jgi:ribose-phosphate pyrophosphokinase
MGLENILDKFDDFKSTLNNGLFDNFLDEIFNHISNRKISVLSGSPDMISYTSEVSKILNKSMVDVKFEIFANGECYSQIQSSVRNQNVYIIQDMIEPIDRKLMWIYQLSDAAKRSGAKSVNVIFPSLPYARQDRVSDKREPISSRIIANNLEANGVDKVITLDVHTEQLQGFYKIPIEFLPSQPLFANYILKEIVTKYPKDTCYANVSPDEGGTKRSKKLKNEIGIDMASAYIDKTRDPKIHNQICGNMNLVGSVDGMVSILHDDILDTGGTIIKAIETLHQNNAKAIYVAISHGMFNQKEGTTKNAMDDFAKLQKEGILSGLYITDTIPLTNKKIEYMNEIGLDLTIIPTAPFIADAIRRINGAGSLSKLFNREYITNKLYNSVETRGPMYYHNR